MDLNEIQYNKIIGQLYSEKLLLEEEMKGLSLEKDEYSNDLSLIEKENQELKDEIICLRKQVADFEEVEDGDKIVDLRKQLKDMTEKKDMYRNERYQLRREIDFLNNQIHRLKRE